MNDCPVCEVGELELDDTQLSVDWVHVYLKCSECGCILTGDIQIDHLEEVN